MRNDRNDPLKTTSTSDFASAYSSDVRRQKWSLRTPKSGVQKWSSKSEGRILRETLQTKTPVGSPKIFHII